MNQLPQVINSLIEAKVASKRIERYLNSEDSDPLNVIWKKEEKEIKEEMVSVEIENGNFVWDKSVVLKNINFSVEKGQFVAVKNSKNSFF